MINKSNISVALVKIRPDLACILSQAMRVFKCKKYPLLAYRKREQFRELFRMAIIDKRFQVVRVRRPHSGWKVNFLQKLFVGETYMRERQLVKPVPQRYAILRHVVTKAFRTKTQETPGSQVSPPWRACASLIPRAAARVILEQGPVADKLAGGSAPAVCDVAKHIGQRPIVTQPSHIFGCLRSPREEILDVGPIKSSNASDKRRVQLIFTKMPRDQSHDPSNQKRKNP